MIPSVHGLVPSRGEVDFNRFPASPAAAGAFKQWVHVAVADPAITLIANFSSIGAPADSALHRLTVLVLADDVRGHTRQLAPERCAVPPGRSRLDFDGNTLTSAGPVHELALDEPALGLRARLAMRAVVRPAALHHLKAGSRGVFHWAVVPRLLATGVIEYGGRSFLLDGAPAYRDRNWGTFSFGDVSWEWGYAAAPADGPSCAVVYSRLMNLARTQIVEQEVLVWWGASLLASFRDREVSCTRSGAFDGPLVTVPPALALCRPGRATDVPEVVTVVARSSRGEIEVRFERSATARILVPNDARLGTTAIYESFAAARVRGTVDDQEIALAGPAMFECVHA